MLVFYVTKGARLLEMQNRQYTEKKKNVKIECHVYWIFMKFRNIEKFQNCCLIITPKNLGIQDQKT